MTALGQKQTPDWLATTLRGTFTLARDDGLSYRIGDDRERKDISFETELLKSSTCGGIGGGMGHTPTGEIRR